MATVSTAPRHGRLDAPLEAVARAKNAATEWLLGCQNAEGYWCGELEADSMLEADYIFGHMLFGTGDPARLQRALNEIERYQKDDGGW